MRRMYSENQLDSIIKEQVEGGTLSNAKPIYCHPINIGYGSWFITMLIFNNDPTPFTFQTFTNWLLELKQKVSIVRIMTSGYTIIDNTYYPASYLSAFATDTIGIICEPTLMGNPKSVTYTEAEWNNITPTIFVDGVNKIN